MNNIWRGAKRGSCSGCDKNNTSPELHVHWGISLGRAMEEEQGSVNARDKEKALQGASHRCFLNAF